MLATSDKYVRPPAVAGSFYPRDAAALRQTVTRLLEGVISTPPSGRVRAVIAPHAGYIYSGAVAAEAFSAVQRPSDQFKRAVIIGPAHFVPFRGLGVPTATAFRTPLGESPIDGDAVSLLADLPQIVADDKPHAPEHALEVELPFLQVISAVLPVVPIVFGAVQAEEVAAALARLWDDKTLIVVSSDLSHYHDYATARRLDLKTARMIESYNQQAIHSQDACGSLAIRGLLIAAEARGLAVDRLDLRNSGDTAGDRRSVVGYGAWAFSEA